MMPGYQQLDTITAAGLPPPPVVSSKKSRRASLVIQETAQLLTGLHEDAHRSDALMAELEQLLAASQQASRPPDRKAADLSDASPEPTATCSFAMVQPLLYSSSSETGESDSDSDESELPQKPQPTSTPADKRRSSVVTFDGTALFPPGFQPSLNIRAPSFCRVRTTMTSGRSWTEGQRAVSLRQRMQTEVGGGPAPSAVPVSVAPGASPGAATLYGGAVGIAGSAPVMARRCSVLRRSSATDLREQTDTRGGDGQSQARHSGLPYTSAPVTSASVMTASQLLSVSQSGVYASEGDGGGGSGGGARSASLSQISKASPSGGSGRFMNILQGIFRPHHDQQSVQSHGSGLAPSCAFLTDSGAPAPDSLAPQRTLGALASMTLSQPQSPCHSLSQPLPFPAQPQSQLRSGASRSSLTNQLVATRGSGGGGGSSLTSPTGDLPAAAPRGSHQLRPSSQALAQGLLVRVPSLNALLAVPTGSATLLTISPSGSASFSPQGASGAVGRSWSPAGGPRAVGTATGAASTVGGVQGGVGVADGRLGSLSRTPSHRSLHNGTSLPQL